MAPKKPRNRGQGLHSELTRSEISVMTSGGKDRWKAPGLGIESMQAHESWLPRSSFYSITCGHVQGDNKCADGFTVVSVSSMSDIHAHLRFDMEGN